MNFLILGGSGRSGKLVVEEVLAKGHTLTALVRDLASLPEQTNLSLIKGSPLNTEDITTAINSSPTSFDAVIVTLNARRVSDSPFAAAHPDSPPNFMATCMTNILTAMRTATHPIRKIVVMSSVGTGSSMSNVNLAMRFVFSHTNMSLSRKDHDLVDAELRKSKDVDFVEVRPWMLADGEAAEVKVYADDGKGAGFMPKITRASVAKFIVEAAETSKYNGLSPVITN